MGYEDRTYNTGVMTGLGG